MRARARRAISGAGLHANLAGLEVGEGLPVRIMGVINVSPESFHAGSVVQGTRALRALAKHMVAEGADLLDIGAMSTAPYGQGLIDAREEERRLVRAVRAVREVVSVPISADTQRSEVAAAALAAGASVINDVSGLTHDPSMAEVARRARGVVLMACESGPSTTPPARMVLSRLRNCLQLARRAGIPPQRIVLDPGIGFFRNASVPWHVFDCIVLRRLGAFHRLGRPLLVGVSRKSFIGRISGRGDVAERLPGSIAAAAIAVYNGAAIIRTHDVAATRDAVRLAEAIRTGGDG
jgi:dihydropteroate synthase